MELVYIYIEKYRNFEEQEISFTERFNIQYHPEENKLSISKRESYVEMYPYNITSVNAIIGKNASGKTSLLDLIGKKIESRHSRSEIRRTKTSNRHRYLDIEGMVQASKDKEELVASYFFVYYGGMDDYGNDVFVFETCNPLKYIGIFMNSVQLTEKRPDLPPDINYYVGKGWFYYVFRCMDNGELLLQTDGGDIKGKDKTIEEQSSIILFKSEFPADFGQDHNPKADEYKISVRRRHALLQATHWYQTLRFLCNQMNNPRSELFKNNSYQIEIKFNFSCHSVEEMIIEQYVKDELDKDRFKKTAELRKIIDIEQHVYPYNKFNIHEMSDVERHVLLFIYGYAIYALENILFYNNIELGKMEERLTELKKIKCEQGSYQKIKEYYHRVIECIFRWRKDEDVQLKYFMESERNLENFLKTAAEHKVEVQFEHNSIILIINPDSQIERVEYFFINCVDEQLLKTEKEEISIMQNYISTDINFLSDGEKANLAMFTALDEQIAIFTEGKTDYILLFDEIERRMHPEMCRMLMNDLFVFLSQYQDKRFQIIVASHSPFIAGDIYDGDIICLRYDREKQKIVSSKPDERTFGQNIHTLLKNGFFLSNTFGEFSTKRIKNIVKYLKEKRDKSELIAMINEDNGNQDIKNYEEAKTFIEYCISNVGEKVLQSHLEHMYSEWNDNLDEQIAFHKSKLKELEEKRRG